MASAATVHAARIEIRDDTGGIVSLEKPAKRIVALYGAYNEILAAMGLQSRIKARTKADDYPEFLRELPAIGTHMRPNVELVISMKPDLVLQSAGRREAMTPVNQLRAQGIPVAVFNPSTFEGLFNVIERIGALTGAKKRAHRLMEHIKGRLRRVSDRKSNNRNRPRVFFEVRHPNLVAAGADSIVNDVIERAGGTNCLRVPKKLARINLEAVIACDPDVYIIQRGPMNRRPSEPSTRPNFHALRAIRKDRVLFVDEQVFSRPGPRLVDAVEKLAEFLDKTN
jgi:iron complex transport system substrate-binding protein